jgi:uncharacterized membrane protein
MAETRIATGWRGWIGWAILGVVLIAAIGPLAPDLAQEFQGVTPHAPDWALWAALPLKIQVHVIAAVTALVIGCVILAQRKGSRLHKTLGWAWVFAMATAAISSLFITGLNGGFYSFVHLLSGWTVIGLPMAIFAIRNRKVETHRRAMTGMFVGGLLIAGALAFLPGRFMFAFFFG